MIGFKNKNFLSACIFSLSLIADWIKQLSNTKRRPFLFIEWSNYYSRRRAPKVKLIDILNWKVYLSQSFAYISGFY